MLVRALRDLRSSLENPSTPLSSDAAWLYDALGARKTSSGQRVSPDKALRLAAVYACVRIISETIASLPLPVYRRTGERGKERATNHPLYRLLHDRPNPDMSSFTFRETQQALLCTWGNGYAEIEQTKAGTPLALWPIHPNRVRVERREGRKMFFVLVDGKWLPFTTDEILHIPGMGFDGLVGYSPIELARQAVGLGLAAEDYGGRFYGNDARPGLVLKHKGRLSPAAQQRLKDSWKEKHGGEERLGVSVLEEGMDVATISIPPEHAQFLETRKFQVTEIARIFRVPPHLLADLERATFSNIEHQGIEFVVHCIRPWTVRWEQVLNWELFGDRSAFFAEFLIDGLLRGDIKSRYDAYAVGRQNGWLSADDIRELENMNPLPDGQGKIYLVQSNMTTPELLLNPPEPKQLPAPAPAPAEEEDDEDDRGIFRPESLELQIVALRRLIEDAVGRMVAREARDAAKAAKDPASFATWLDSYYARHLTTVSETLLPVVQMHVALTLCEDDPVDRALALAAEHTRLSVEALRAVSVTEVLAVVEHWETQRPRLLADKLMGEELRHVFKTAAA